MKDTLHNGDFLNLSKKLEDNSIDLAVCDPPYNLSKGGKWKWNKSKKLPGFGGEWNKVMQNWDDMSFAEYTEFTIAWLKEVKRVVKPEGSDLQFMIKKSKIEENYVLVDNVIKTFKTNNKKKIILSNVNFQISKGEFTCILGPSGCGKSTLLDLLAGFTKPDEGLISVSDEVVRKPGPERGFVFQKNSLIPWQTLEQNVGYGLKLQKLNSKGKIAYIITQ